MLQEIAKAKKKPAEARAVIQIGFADGDFDRDEQAIVREACYALDLPPREFALWQTGHAPQTTYPKMQTWRSQASSGGS